MKKIIIVTDVWPSQVTGVVTVFARMTKLLEERGIRVIVVNPLMFRRVYPFPLYPEQPFAIFPGKQMQGIFEREKPDAVHIATEWPIGLSARNYCLRKKIPFTTSYHTNFPLYAAHYFKWAKFLASIASLYMHWFHRAAEKMLVSTESLKKKLESEGYSNVVVWPFGIDAELFERDEKHTSNRARALPKPVFVYFGRVSTEKNVSEFAALSLPGTKLVIGDGPLRKQLERKYPDTLFIGYRRKQELVDWLSACDVCVFPSRTETFGMAVLEALACGLPVAAHDVLGPRDMITDGIEGFLDEDLGRAAQKCLNLSRETCRAKALTYSWNTSADIFIKHCGLSD